MKISKKAQYGLRAMVYLAKNSSKDNLCSLKEVSRKEEIPFDFLEKIIMELQNAGFTKAKKGVTGGYFLAKLPKKITAGEIVRALEDTVPVSCAGCQMARNCSTKNVWGKVQDSVDSTLDSMTLADLIHPVKSAVGGASPKARQFNGVKKKSGKKK